MSLSLRKVGLAAGATLLLTAATASSAMAANPITLSMSGSSLVIDDPTGVIQAETIKTSGSGFEITELTSGNELVLGADVDISVYWSNTHLVVVPAAGKPAFTSITWWGRGGGDLVNASAVTNVPVWLFGDTGSDFIVGGTGADLLNGGADNDQVKGGGGNDVINGGTGADDIFGQNGDDQIIDKDGFADYVDGGNDYDTFRRDAGLDTATNIELYS